MPTIRQLVPDAAAVYHALRFYEAAGFRAFGIEERAIKVAGRYYPKAHMTLDLRAR